MVRVHRTAIPGFKGKVDGAQIGNPASLGPSCFSVVWPIGSNDPPRATARFLMGKKDRYEGVFLASNQPAPAHISCLCSPL